MKNKMKNRVSLVILSMLLCFSMQSCHPAYVDAGEEGVFVKTPWFFGHGGVLNSKINI